VIGSVKNNKGDKKLTVKGIYEIVLSIIGISSLAALGYILILLLGIVA
jgi:hypothetical protein